MKLIEQRSNGVGIVCYLPEVEVIVCMECRYALNRSPGVVNHLKDAYSWSLAKAKAMDQQFIGKAVQSPCKPNCTWILPKPEDPNIPYLPLLGDGLSCHVCQFVCRTESTIKKHCYIYKHHRDEINPKKLKELYRKKVQIQWFTKGGAHNLCFEVNRQINAKPPLAPCMDTATQIRQKLHLRIQQQTNAVKESLAIFNSRKITEKSVRGWNALDGSLTYRVTTSGGSQSWWNSQEKKNEC